MMRRVFCCPVISGFRKVRRKARSVLCAEIGLKLIELVIDNSVTLCYNYVIRGTQTSDPKEYRRNEQ